MAKSLSTATMAVLAAKHPNVCVDHTLLVEGERSSTIPRKRLWT